ncbi:hypothetical protein EDD16DRAFT_1636311 [Pisolithus croceorrhizus]|nr:hypothetical protein EDD16DRAFT_1636311 [Pisolithus croceorrhizus]KAI6159414.1 hypothetical protein EDD17DRAFT_1612514 [Pisolithus thermaeus]
MTIQTPSPIAGWDETFPYISFLIGGVSSTMCVASGLGLVTFPNAVLPQIVGVSVLLFPFFTLIAGMYRTVDVR